MRERPKQRGWTASEAGQKWILKYYYEQQATELNEWGQLIVQPSLGTRTAEDRQTLGMWQFLGLRSLPILCPPLFWTDWTIATRCSSVYRLPLLQHFSEFRTQQRDSSKSSSVREIVRHQHCVTYTDCLFSIVSATNYVFWCTLYIPAIVHLICLILLLLPQISLPECISDLPGLTVMDHWQLGWSLTNAVFPMLGLKLGTACPKQFRK